MAKITTRPPDVAPLAQKKIWVNYSKSKIPINPKKLRNAGSTYPDTWTDYRTAAANIGKTATVKFGKGKEARTQEETVLGVGIVLGDASGLSGMDFDHCIKDGVIDPDVLQIIKTMDSYTETSPSGTGVHILFFGKCPVKGIKVEVNGKSREMYRTGRYFTVTGNVYGSYNRITERSEQATAVYREHYRPYRTKKKTTVSRKKGKTDVHNANPAVQAIINHDADYFKKTLKEPPRTFDNQEQFFNYIYSYPLPKFLGVNAAESISCFFHDDRKPSAEIYQAPPEMGRKWLYYCHAENMTLTIKTLVEKAGDFESELDSIDFIKKALNLKITDNKWTRRQNKIIDLILDKLIRTDTLSFAALCPTADRNIRFGKDLFMKILILAKSTIYPSKNKDTGDVLFYMSLDQITAAAGRSSKDKTLRWIKALQYHGLMQAVPDNEIPPDLLNKARRQAENQYRHIGFYRIPSLVIKRLTYVESQGKQWKANGYTIKGVSYELFYRAEGPEVANALYPQRLKGTGTIATVGTKANAKAEARHAEIHTLALDLLQEQGYFTESQILERCASQTWGSVQLKRSLTDIANTYGLVRTKAGKALKQQFGIVSDGYPYIYIPG